MSRKKKYIIFGPPAVGKSSTLGRVAQATSKGEIPFKVTVCDLEAFYTKDTKQGTYRCIMNLINKNEGVVVIGGGAMHPKMFSSNFRILLAPRTTDQYKELLKSKELRGIGHGYYESIVKYHSFTGMEISWDFEAHDAEEIVELIKIRGDVR